MDTLWNLVDTFCFVEEQPLFFPPLAVRIGEETIAALPAKDQFTPKDQKADLNSPFFDDEDKPVFEIQIAPSTSLGGDPNLPDLAFRLHAMAPGRLTFTPARRGRPSQLVLAMELFKGTVPVPWFERWREARAIPIRVVYKNVDSSLLTTIVNRLLTQPEAYGLRLPSGITNAESHIERFLRGTQGAYLVAKGGAVIGAAAVDSDDATKRLLKLMVEYQDPRNPRGRNSAVDYFVNPREFFHLLFGDDSGFAKNHPLLVKMNEVGMAQQAAGLPRLASRTMRLRPPLRTSARVKWEAEREIESDEAEIKRLEDAGEPEGDRFGFWARDGDCSNRFYNSHRRQSKRFNSGTYLGSWKCNLFVHDVLLRSGFRTGIHPVGTRWHYASPNQIARKLDRAPNTHTRQPLRGGIGTGSRNRRFWAWKLDRWLSTLEDPAQPRAANLAINNAIVNEGRCIVLVGSRSGNSGHIMIVDEVRDEQIIPCVQPKDPPTEPPQFDRCPLGNGLSQIKLDTYEASFLGAKHDRGEPGPPDGKLVQTNGAQGSSASAGNYAKLFLIEYHPGKDPDVPLGLRDCNVQI